LFMIRDATDLIENQFNSLKSQLKSILVKNTDISTPEGRAQERTKRIALTAASAILARLFAMMIPLITVRISLDYLGVEIYGLWMTVTSLGSLTVFADFGLGNGLQTRLSQTSAKDDSINESCQLISSTFYILMLVSTVLILAFLLIYPSVNWAHLINAKMEFAKKISGPVVLAIFIPILINIPLALVQRTQLALQEGYRGNLWQIVGNLLSLVSVYVFAKLNMGALILIWGSSIIPAVVSFLNMFIYYGFQMPHLRPCVRYVDRVTLGTMFRTGAAFFTLSIFTTLGLYIDNFIVARISNLVDVTSYSIIFKISQIMNVIIMMLSTPLWPAYGEALTRGDIDWVRRNTKRTVKITTSLALVLSLGIFVCAGFIFKIWLGPNFNYSILTLAGMLMMQVLYAFINPYFMVLNGAGIVVRQILIFAVYTTITLSLKFFLALRFGIGIIPWVGMICYGFLVVPFVIIIARETCNTFEKR
jgi:O-antigen/teichoic acid export membrane protein